MASFKRSPVIPARIVSDPTIMSGEPVVRGTRVPAATIVAYLRAGRTNVEIFQDYPTLPIDGISAVMRWAETTFGPDWKTAPSRNDGSVDCPAERGLPTEVR